MLEALSPLTLAAPGWLLLALVPLLLALGRRQAQRFADPHLLPWLQRGPAPGRSGRLALAAAWATAALAASQPYWDSAQEPQQAPVRDIAVVVDISPSMTAADTSPNRLDRAKLELQALLNAHQRDRLALIAFSANAYPILPLTTDRQVFQHTLDRLAPALASEAGSNGASALEWARRLLQGSEPGSSAVVLISDGEFHRPGTRAAARTLAQANIPLLVLGVGTAAGAPVRDSDGRLLRHQGEVVVSRRQREQLQALAQITGGHYSDVRPDAEDWQPLLAKLATLAPQERSTPGPQAQALFPPLLALSLLLFLVTGIRRYALTMFAILALGLGTVPSPVSAASAQAAYEALQAGDYQRAARLYADLPGYLGRLGEGTAAYRLGRWQSALAAFRDAEQAAADTEQAAQAAYNAGNTLAQMQRWQAARQAYQRALDYDPDHRQAAINLSLVGNRSGDDRDASASIPQEGGPGRRVEGDRGHTDPPRQQAAQSASSSRQAVEWSAGASGQPALSNPGDDPQALLRHRFQWQDQQATGAAAEERPW